MKLLFDENLSPRLVQALEPEYPGSAHVRALGLRGATDEAIWEQVPSSPELERLYLPDAGRVAAAVRRLLGA